MVATTFEEAKLCPRCKLPGEDASRVPAARGAVVHVIFCRNEKCRWYNTSWLVQVNRDGSVPTAEYSTREPKKFPVNESLASQAEDVAAALRRERELQQKRTGEVRNPYA